MKKTIGALLTLMLLASGCSQSTATPAVMTEPERIIKPHRMAGHSPDNTVELSSIQPFRVSHQSATSPQQASPVQPSPLSFAPSPASIEVLEWPKPRFRAFPVFRSEDEVIGVEFSPAQSKAEWMLSSRGAAIVSKVKISVSDENGATVDSTEFMPTELGLPRELDITQKLAIAPELDAVLKFLKSHPHCKGFDLRIVLESTNGTPMTTASGELPDISVHLDVL